MSHISTVETMSNQLKDLVVGIDETKLITKIIMTLPPSYRHFQSTWDMLQDKEKNITTLTAKLCKEETMNKFYGYKEEKDAAFFGRNQQAEPAEKGGRFPKKFIPKGRGPRCSYCGYNNHSIENCRNWIRDENETTAQVATHSTRYPRVNKYEDDAYAFTSNSSGAMTPNDRYADSGASHHMTDQRSLFYTFQEVEPGSWPVKGIGINNKPLQAHGYGIIKIRSLVDVKWHDGKLSNTVYVPSIGVNLFSTGAAADLGITITFNKNQATLHRNSKIAATGTRAGRNLYHLNIQSVRQDTDANISTAVNNLSALSIWHQRLGHVNYGAIEKTMTMQAVDGLNIKNSEHTPCDGCALGKSSRGSFPSGEHTRALNPGELVHSDVCGPMSVPSSGGSRYFVCFKDDATCFRVIYFMKLKSEVMEHFENYVNRVKNETGNPIKTLRTDNGGKYINTILKKFLAKKGIRHETSAPHTPQQNGAAERENRIIMESARSMLHGKHLQLELWAEAVNTT